VEPAAWTEMGPATFGGADRAVAPDRACHVPGAAVVGQLPGKLGGRVAGEEVRRRHGGPRTGEAASSQKLAWRTVCGLGPLAEAVRPRLGPGSGPSGDGSGRDSPWTDGCILSAVSGDGHLIDSEPMAGERPTVHKNRHTSI
jgi:hypothetical protein